MPNAAHRPARPVRPVSTAVILVRFAAAGVVGVIILAALFVWDLKEDQLESELLSARQITAVLAKGVIEPQLAPSIARGDRKAVASLDAAVRSYVLSVPLVRVKLWAATGEVLYSTEARLIGHTYPLRPEQLAAIRGHGVESAMSTLARPENSFETAYGQLVEVYAGVRDREGHEFLFEAYFSMGPLARPGMASWLRDAAAALVALVALQLAQVPFGWFLARRVRRHQEDRDQLVRQAADASAAERRRIVADLHDGVVQELNGISYLLDAAGSTAGADDGQPAVAAGMGARLRGSVAALRGLLIDIYPPDLDHAGLAAAMDEMADQLRRDGIRVHLHVTDVGALPDRDAALLFRAARELLHNVAAHSGATEVTVRAGCRDGVGWLVVGDNGHGFDPAPTERPGTGHFGLRVLNDLVTAAGGRLIVRSTRGRGTTVRAEVPHR
jgi:two-component system, NarL family, sensor kinase